MYVVHIVCLPGALVVGALHADMGEALLDEGFFTYVARVVTIRPTVCIDHRHEQGRETVLVNIR